MNTDQLLTILSGMPRRSVTLTPQQEAVIRHPEGPAWVLAGPGSGKTEILTILLLRLIYVESDPVQGTRVPPESIFVTTFTKKAARNLEDRLATYRSYIVGARPELASIDISKLRIGTLHSLCNDLLQEFRYPGYQNIRLMEGLEQGMFVYELHSLVNNPNPAADMPFWSHFSYLFKPYEWQPTYRNLPNKWSRTAALVKLFDRIVEDRVSVPGLAAAGGQLGRLATAYEEYAQLLRDNYRCDFAHLQKVFLDFLESPIGQVFLNGDPADSYRGIRWTLVDEYQDTNLIQEEIYLRLAGTAPHNLAVVGDDDQALYRFRGGSVECMVTFDSACESFLGVPRTSVVPYPLTTNFRSHSAIVDFCNDYITSFPVMGTPGARVPGKPALTAGGRIAGIYPAVGTLEGRTLAEVAANFAQTVRDLIDNGIVSDPSQCCLLLRSTKETPQNAGQYVDALRARGLEPYNPRNKAYLEQEEIQTLLGALLAMLDPDQAYVPTDPAEIPAAVTQWNGTYAAQAAANPRLRDYVAEARARIGAAPMGEYLNANLQEILYFLLALPPFTGWLDNPVNRARLAKVTDLIESYSATPVPGYPNISRGTLRISTRARGQIVEGWLRRFYYLFIGYLSQQGIDDIEDEEVICPMNMVPVMTIHQAKGLEFPFVFVGHVTASAQVSDVHRLEDVLGQYPINPARAFTRPTAPVRAQLDLIRQFFVAYSRSQYALVVLGTRNQLGQGQIPCGPFRGWLRRRTLPL
jgi:DNA helicase II / ATP-dependent DNA helicase PcrA